MLGKWQTNCNLPCSYMEFFSSKISLKQKEWITLLEGGLYKSSEG